jgi:hypothetical protein
MKDAYPRILSNPNHAEMRVRAAMILPRGKNDDD